MYSLNYEGKESIYMKQTALCNLSKWRPLTDGAQGDSNLSHPKGRHWGGREQA